VTADDIFRVLAHERCRTILMILDQYSSSIPESVLANLVATEERVDSSNAETEAIQSALHHHHLPALEAVGLIEYTEDGEIASVPSAIWADQTFKSYVETNVISASDVSNALIALSNERRREALDVLRRNERITIEQLASRIEHSESELDDPGSDVESSGILLELLHVHIPKLADYGIVESDGQHVQYIGDTLLDEWWFDASSSTESGGGE
jgi:DNA-binding transcriptional ArsR family regulator